MGDKVMHAAAGRGWRAAWGAAWVAAGMGPLLMLLSALAQAAPAVMRVEVDASDTRQRIFRVRQSLPVQPGPLTLLYPQWVPGNHGPTGNATQLAGLRLQAAGQTLPWRRLPKEPFAFAVEVPRGVEQLDIEFQYLSALQESQGPVVVTPTIVALRWHALLLYPRGVPVEQLPVQATVRLPEGWAMATGLDVQARSGARVTFQPVSVGALVDSPVWAGAHLQRHDLATEGTPPAALNVLADAPEDLQPSAEQLATWRALTQQAARIFGPAPYRRYEFLLGLNAGFMSVALEHRNSNELSMPPGIFSRWSSLPHERRNIAHEFVHAWMGKLAAPAGLVPDDLNTPVDTTELWIYEGQTEYWGQLLRARSGELSRELTLQLLARNAALMAARRGNEWRSLQDTVYEPVLRSDRLRAWNSWQRNVDYYTDGAFLWMAVDARIRQLSGGQRSLDDAARRFFAGRSPQQRAFDRADLIAALDAVAPEDWARFLDQRLNATGQDLARGALEAAGWRLVFKPQQSDYDASIDRQAGVHDLTYTLGLSVANDGRVTAVQWEGEAFKAGLAPGAQLMAVNGRSFSAAGLKQAIAEAGRTRQPLELVVRADERVRTLPLRSDEGLRYPHLERIADRPDLLSAMLAARP